MKIDFLDILNIFRQNIFERGLKMKNTDICPVQISGFLDNKIRKLFQNPDKILKPYMKEGLTVLDIGCGPGFFTIPIAQMVGENGKVIAADLQEGMLQKVRKKITGTELEKRIALHKCGEKELGINEKVDFILLFYMLHEVPDKKDFFRKLSKVLKEDGIIFIVEPPFHVSEKGFEQSIKDADEEGFICIERPKMFLDKAMILKKKMKMIRKLAEKEIPLWLELAAEVESLFGKMAGNPEFEEAVKEAVKNGEVFCHENEKKEITGVVALSKAENSIEWLAVKENSKGKGISKLLIEKAISELNEKKDITVQTFTEEVPEGIPARKLYFAFGFRDYKKSGINPAGIETVIMKRDKIN